jgi:hypothetical protein
VADKPKPTGADKPEPELEKLVARRIREQLGEGGLQKLIGARQQIQAKMEASGTVTRAGELTAHGELTADAVAVVESASPELASDIRNLSPEHANLAINLYLALLQTLQFLLVLYQMVHHQPPTQPQIVQIFNQTTIVFNHTTNNVINMPPGHG